MICYDDVSSGIVRVILFLFGSPHNYEQIEILLTTSSLLISQSCHNKAKTPSPLFLKLLSRHALLSFDVLLIETRLVHSYDDEKELFQIS